MPKKLTQHEIRQRAVQTIFSFHMQTAMSSGLMRDFESNVQKMIVAIERPVRFVESYKDERITVRTFKKSFMALLSKLAENYASLGIELDKSALAKALAFVRDFGGYAKKMRDNDAAELYYGIFGNLNLVRLFSIDLDDDAPVAPKVLEFLRALPKDATPSQAQAVFNQVFALVHENVREKFTEKLFEPATLQAELTKELAKAKSRFAETSSHLLDDTEKYVLNYDSEEAAESLDPLETPAYYQELVTGTLDNEEELAQLLSQHLTAKWNFERLTNVEQAILLLGAYEIKHTDTPDVVAINEAIELAKNFSDVKSSRFINGVLTNLIKK